MTFTVMGVNDSEYRMMLSHLFGLREAGSKLFIAVWREKAGWICTFFLRNNYAKMALKFLS